MNKVAAKIFLVCFFLLILLGTVCREGRFLGFSLKGETDSARPFALQDVRKLFPAAEKVVLRAADEAEAYAADGTRLGSLVHTQPMAKHIIGYGSFLPILVGINNEKRITGIVLQANSETPGFITRLEKQGFFNTWNGLAASEVVEKNFDAVSRATMTSSAVINSLKLRLARFIELENARQKLDYRVIGLEVLAWVFLLFSLAGVTFPAKVARFRTAILLMAVIVPGFLLGRFFSLELLRTWAINGVPFAAQPYLALVAMLTVLIPLVTGKAYYCTWFCPYGAAQELAGRIFKRKINLSGAVLDFCRWLRSAFLMIIVFLLLIGLNVEVSRLEPFSAFLYKSASDSVIILALLFLFLSLFIRKPWCNYVCPSGTIVETLRSWPVSQALHANKQENSSMRTQEVISLLLAIAVIVLLLSPDQSGKNAQHARGQEISGQKSSGNASTGGQAGQKEKGSEKARVVFENIFQRKSVRDYTGQLVSKEILVDLVKAGMAAPTAINRQPWQFVVVNDRETIARLTDQLPYAKMLASAGAAIIVCGDLEIAKAGGTENLWVQDCSAATQNILLAAESMGLGAVWTAAYPYDDRMAAVVAAAGLPAHVVPLNVIPVGYPTGSEKPKDKWKPERLHWNKYGSGEEKTSE